MHNRIMSVNIITLYLEEFPPFFEKGDNFYDFLFAFPARHVPAEKGSTLKGMNLLPRGANSFLFRADHFSAGLNKF